MVDFAQRNANSDGITREGKKLYWSINAMTKSKMRKRYRVMDARYKILWGGDRCYYCADMADSYDHVPSLDTTYSFGADRLLRRGVKLWKVKSCRQCNNILSNRLILYVDHRARFLYEYYKKKYERRLIDPNWEEDELDELDYTLRSYIEDNETVKLWMERRLQFMEEMEGNS